MSVEELPGLQAVVELTDHAVEQVPLGLGVPVAPFTPSPVVGVGSGRGPERGEGPEEARRDESVVLDEAASDVVLLAGSTGDRCGACIGLQGAGVGEAVTVISDLGQY